MLLSYFQLKSRLLIGSKEVEIFNKYPTYDHVIGHVEVHDQDNIYIHETLASDSGHMEIDMILIVNLHMTYDGTAELIYFVRYILSGIFSPVNFVWYILSGMFCPGTFCPAYFVWHVLSGYILSSIFCLGLFCLGIFCPGIFCPVTGKFSQSPACDVLTALCLAFSNGVVHVDSKSVKSKVTIGLTQALWTCLVASMVSAGI